MKNNKFLLRQVRFDEARTAIESIRRQVFIEEQQVPEELEWDGLDDEAIHLLVTDDNAEPVATARMLDNGHIGRMAVLAEWRHQGIGRAMLAALLDIGRQRGLRHVFLNAQLGALDFYARSGFKAEGEIFMDAGIPHKRMVLELGQIG